MVRKDMLEDEDWIKLSSPAKIIWIYMRSKFNNKTLSEITMTYSELRKLYTPKTVSRSFIELQEKGFIEQTAKGGLNNPSKFKFKGKYANFIYNQRHNV